MSRVSGFPLDRFLAFTCWLRGTNVVHFCSFFNDKFDLILLTQKDDHLCDVSFLYTLSKSF